MSRARFGSLPRTSASGLFREEEEEEEQNQEEEQKSVMHRLFLGESACRRLPLL